IFEHDELLLGIARPARRDELQLVLPLKERAAYRIAIKVKQERREAANAAGASRVAAWSNLSIEGLRGGARERHRTGAWRRAARSVTLDRRQRAGERDRDFGIVGKERRLRGGWRCKRQRQGAEGRAKHL